MKTLRRIVGLGACGWLVGCEPSPPPAPPKAPPPPAAAPAAPATPEKRVTLAEVGLDAEALDRKADPCQDFFQ
ncbi:MAG TPA: hypothetical protein VFS00_01645, partial [Polyangiaceae bacterium]|nr:hypothetical protein [Polyangiaceae bacterium]